VTTPTLLVEQQKANWIANEKVQREEEKQVKTPQQRQLRCLGFPEWFFTSMK
jgi:hypothetical protein